MHDTNVCWLLPVRYDKLPPHTLFFSLEALERLQLKAEQVVGHAKGMERGIAYKVGVYWPGARGG